MKPESGRGGDCIKAALFGVVMPKPRTPQHLLDKAIKAYEDGLQGRKAAKFAGIGYSTFRKAMNERGISYRPATTPKTSPCVLDAIVEDYISGATYEAAAAKFGLTEMVCRRELKARGIKPRARTEPPPRVSKEVRDGMIEGYAGGKSMSATAAIYGLSKNVCKAELKRRGVKVRALKTDQKVTDGAVQAYVDGSSLVEAGNRFRVSATFVSRELKKRGIAVRPLVEQEVLDGIVQAYLEGATATQAAKQYQRSVTVCLSELKKRQIPLRPKAEPMPRNRWVSFMMTRAYLDWRRSVLKQSGNTCSDCGTRKQLEAHHIFPKAAYPFLALDTSNGICLCKKCHCAIQGKEERHAARYLAIIGSNVAPMVFFDKRPDAVK